MNVGMKMMKIWIFSPPKATQESQSNSRIPKQLKKPKATQETQATQNPIKTKK
jgi:hypothetical protein